MIQKSSIGLLGGTFDPIHHGHLRAAIEIYEQFQLDEIRFIPCKTPPHRTTPQSSAKNRLEMAKLAVIDTPFTIDDREMHREGPSYTVDTLISLRKENPNASLCMIVGADAFLLLPTWHQWEKIIQLANIIVMYRAGCPAPDLNTLAEPLKKHVLASHEKIIDFNCGKITQHMITSLDISASQLRHLIKTGHSTQFLLPANVLAYIEKHGLYDYPGHYSANHSTEISKI